MDKIETLAEFYERKFDWMPDTILNETVHFNIFKVELFVGDKAKKHIQFSPLKFRNG